MGFSLRQITKALEATGEPPPPLQPQSLPSLSTALTLLVLQVLEEKPTPRTSPFWPCG